VSYGNDYDIARGVGRSISPTLIHSYMDINKKPIIDFIGICWMMALSDPKDLRTQPMTDEIDYQRGTYSFRCSTRSFVTSAILLVCFSEPWLGKVWVYQPKSKEEMFENISHFIGECKKWCVTNAWVLHVGDKAKDSQKCSMSASDPTNEYSLTQLYQGNHYYQILFVWNPLIINWPV
jgi:hypothetical protein